MLWVAGKKGIAQRAKSIGLKAQGKTDRWFLSSALCFLPYAHSLCPMP